MLIYGSLNEKDVHSHLSSALIFISFPTFMILMGVIPAPYGKHSNSSKSTKWGPTLNARSAWLLFECPNLIWSLACFYLKDDTVFRPLSASSTYSANHILLLLFVIHYIVSRVYIWKCLSYTLLFLARDCVFEFLMHLSDT